MITTQIRNRSTYLLSKAKLLLMVMLLPLSIMAQTITNYSPTNGASGVSITDNLVFTFDASIILNDDSFSFISIRDADDVNIIYYSLDASMPGSAITTSGSTLTINPPGSLPYNKNITITIPDDIIYFGGSSYYSGLDFSNFGFYTFTTETAPPDNTAPTLSSISPADNATNVATQSNFFATLSEQIIGTTANINIRRMSNDAIIQSFPANEIVGTTGFYLNPEFNLTPNTSYYIEVPDNAITDLSGNGFAGIAKPDWSFTTGADVTNPIRTSSNPSNSILNDLSANLEITFSERVQKGTGNVVIYKRIGSTNTILETIPVASGQVTINSKVMIINPSTDLPENLDWVFVNINATAIDDLYGNSYAGINNTTSWRFSTGDPNPPVPTTFVPADNGTASTLSQNLSIVFDEDIQLGTGTIALYQSGGALVESFDAASSPRLSASGLGFSIDPTSALLEGTAYYITVDAGAIQDIFGNNYAGFSNNTTWNFTTADTSNPIVSSFNPTDNSTNVPTGSNLVITFNEAIQKGSGLIRIRQSAGGVIVETINVTSGLVTITGSVVTINPSALLPSNEGVYVTIASTAFDDIAGNSYAGINTNSAWNFTTEVGGDVTPPVLSSNSPLDEATGVDVFTDLVLTFNEDVQAGSGSIIVRRYDNNAALKTINITSGEVTFNNNQITIDLPGKLLLQTQVYVQIINGAIQDLAGNNYGGTSGNEDWDFTTEAPSPPIVTSLSPADGATGVAANGQIFTLTFNEDVFASTGFVQLKLATNNSTVESFSDADFTFNGNQVSFTSATPMVYNTGYYITVQFGSFDDIKGSPFAGFNDNATWAFTTEPEPDLTAPSITTLNPADNATGIANNSWVFTATFNEPVQLGNGPVASRIIYLVRSGDNGIMATAPSFNSSRVTISGNVVTVDFNGDGSLNAFSLDNNTGYHIEIGENCFEDLAGNEFAGIANNTTWNYTTDAGDVTAPLMTSLSPTDNATGISVTNWVYTINFNEGIQVGSGIISLKKSSNDGLIGNAAIGTVRALVSGSQLTIDFNADGGLGSFEMDNSTEYYIEIPAGTVEDLAGNNFAGIAKQLLWMLPHQQS